MMLFLILAPYGAFATLMLLTSASVSLFASAAICLAAMAYDIAHGRSIKMLGAGSAMVFAALGGYLTLVDPGWSTSAVKLAVDAGVLAISLASLLDPPAVHPAIRPRNGRRRNRCLAGLHEGEL